MSVGDQPDQNGKEIGDACEVREMVGDDGGSGSRRSRGLRARLPGSQIEVGRTPYGNWFLKTLH
jgi:hypothetical protein